MTTPTRLTPKKDRRQPRLPEVDAVAAHIGGGVLEAALSGYEAARQVRNGTVDRRPAPIARRLHDGDARSTVRLARAHRMFVGMRGSGQHIAATGVAQGGLMIDLSEMRADSPLIEFDTTIAHSPGPAPCAAFQSACGQDSVFRMTLSIAPATPLAERPGIPGHPARPSEPAP